MWLFLIIKTPLILGFKCAQIKNILCSGNVVFIILYNGHFYSAAILAFHFIKKITIQTNGTKLQLYLQVPMLGSK